MLKKWILNLIDRRVISTVTIWRDDINYVSKKIDNLDTCLVDKIAVLMQRLKSIETKHGILNSEVKTFKENSKNELNALSNVLFEVIDISKKELKQSIENSYDKLNKLIKDKEPQFNKTINYQIQHLFEKAKKEIDSYPEKIESYSIPFKKQFNDYYHNLLTAFKNTLNGLDAAKFETRISALEAQQLRIALNDVTEREADKTAAQG